MLRAISRFQAEQALQGFEEAVAPTGARGLLQSYGRLVQKLVEQRLTELLELGAIFRREVHPPQRPLHLDRAEACHALSQLRDHRHDGETAIPGPKTL